MWLSPLVAAVVTILPVNLSNRFLPAPVTVRSLLMLALVPVSVMWPAALTVARWMSTPSSLAMLSVVLPLIDKLPVVLTLVV